MFHFLLKIIFLIIIKVNTPTFNKETFFLLCVRNQFEEKKKKNKHEGKEIACLLLPKY